MAVLAGIYGDETPRYTGCVLDKYERNGAWDSDWYAICWDDEEKKIVEVNYDTTRAGGGGWANIDATMETLLKVYRYYKEQWKGAFDEYHNIAQAKKVRTGDEVKVVRGRKIPKGTVGKVFWVGTRYNIYSHQEEARVGIEVDGERMFLPLEYVEVIGWESRLIRGKERKRIIRESAISSLPPHYRSIFRQKKPELTGGKAA